MAGDRSHRIPWRAVQSKETGELPPFILTVLIAAVVATLKGQHTHEHHAGTTQLGTEPHAETLFPEQATTRCVVGLPGLVARKAC